MRGTGYATDPRVIYDRLTQRWFVSMINAPAQPNRVMLAVSSGSTISGTSSFTFFYFQQDSLGDPGNAAGQI